MSCDPPGSPRAAGSPGRPVRACLRAWALVAMAAGACTPTRAEDLLALYHLARQHDPVLQAALHGFDAARERLPQARAGLLPTAGLVGNSGVQSGQASFAQTPYLDRTVHSRGWTLQLSQPLWRPAARIAYEQAGWQERLAGEQLHQAEQDFILRLAQAYFDALLAGESLHVARGQEAAVQTQLALASRNYEVGSATVTDVHEAQSRHDLARAQVAAAEAELQARLAELERSLGYLPGALASLALQGGELPQPADDLQAWMERARLQHPAVRIQEAALAVAEAEVARSQAAHGPTLDLVASYGRNVASGSMGSPADVGSRVEAGQVGLNFHLPLFAGGAVSARVREALALREKAQDELEAARRQAAAQARQAWSGLAHARQQARALASAVESSRSAVEDNRVGYRIGTRINIDVLNAEQQLYAAQRALFKARVDMLLQTLRLKAAAGMLDESDLATVNGLLQPPA